MHHGRPWGTSKTFLLAYSPLCGLSSESHAVCPVSPMRYADIHLHGRLMNRLITSTEHMFRAFLAARGTSRKNPAGQGSWEDGTWKGNVSNFNFGVWNYQIVDSGTTLPLPSPVAYWKPVAHPKSWRLGVHNLCFQHEKALIQIDFEG